MNNLSLIERSRILELSQESLFEESEDASSCRDYLKTRGVSKKIVKDFGIGYVPRRVSHFLNDRLILPVRYIDGELAYLTTRKFRDMSSNRGHWHESFDKSIFFFCHPHAYKAAYDKKLAIVVEGQFDCISVAALGHINTFSILGSNFSKKQMMLLFSMFKNVILFFDNDEAGRISSDKVFDLFFKEKLYKKGFSLSKWPKYDAKDPDDMCRNKNADIAKEYLDSTISKILGEINVRRNIKASVFDF